MLWVYVVDTNYLCRGAHAHECCPQYIPHNIRPRCPHYIVQFILRLCCGCMLWVPITYVVEHMSTNVVHNMYPTTYALVVHIISSTLYWGYVVGVYCGLHLPMLWMTCSRMLSTIYSCSPQYMICCGEHLSFFTMLPTTYTHNI